MPQPSTRSEAREDNWHHAGLFADAGPLGPRSGPHDAADERLVQLARAIELEIIPRLMLAHRAANECVESAPGGGYAISAAEVRVFALQVISADEDLAFGHVETLRTAGVSIEALYLDLMAPTARCLGDMWSNDECDFMQVTAGLGRLQRMLRELSPEFQNLAEAAPIGRRVLLLPCPGEQHTFGLVMVSEFFRRAGWDVAGGSWEFGMDAPTLVASDWYDVIGFSMGAQTHVEQLNACIRAVRQASRNSAIGIMVGGPLFSLQPELLAEVGADVVATDGKQAPELAERLIAQRGAMVG